MLAHACHFVSKWKYINVVQIVLFFIQHVIQLKLERSKLNGKHTSTGLTYLLHVILDDMSTWLG